MDLGNFGGPEVFNSFGVQTNHQLRPKLHVQYRSKICEPPNALSTRGLEEEEIFYVFTFLCH